jgi:uncharacterized protein (DUF4415 family)
LTGTKNCGNLKKHGIDFETARLVFEDPHSLSELDRIVDEEERWQTIGMVGLHTLFVVHLWWDEDGEEVIRVISARKASAREKRVMKLTKKQAKQLRALGRMKDEDIDFSDIPEKLDWSNAIVGKFYRPVKESLTIRIDADVLAWLKKQGKGYQTRINSYLRQAMVRNKKKAGTVGVTRKKKSAS